DGRALPRTVRRGGDPRLGPGLAADLGHEARGHTGTRLDDGRQDRLMSTPVSWLLIEPGWRVDAADGTEIGRVEEVTGDSGADVFDGLSISTGLIARPKYVPSEDVGGIVGGRVRLPISREAFVGFC